MAVVTYPKYPEVDQDDEPWPKRPLDLRILWALRQISSKISRDFVASQEIMFTLVRDWNEDPP